ncbi:MAG: TMEM165/GDT1 family protein [Microcoleus sp. PH2017_10_PVI_O_A]|nr:TMEM165/GDT1 family protein [Microcoleus sp. PH2017_10_PVI_O_A]MCC3459600.1 TMEM165/GDT1 family protein [Microcoleus sp. PH2017_11_PCY_U_A]MCC3478098.1 TMEM165/GDT1 family protein [Microcoleus sp. PH2017_12_PCY_D_A]MCC3528088.1 TMEM165/GDT1 family protein [Microcoleus sp. PH2017_21_RUC_O_A]MCC3540119.1 TMEM165/GDT1 family protein [Microcoleus sp. PH2017_22_RUC_O_B]MCC3558953.1 TMEM165/GDT1 family protein [Microcoleus sp. PH2017_27_LUM_O_A]
MSASDSANPNCDLPPQLERELKETSEIWAALSPEPAELSVSANPELCQEEKELKPQDWAIFASTFATIFLAEIGDKTQLAILLMTAESRNPWIVFAGAGSALIATSLLGVLLGRWLATRIAPQTLERAAGVILLAISAVLLWEVLS